MPFASPASVPDNVKSFWNRVGATESMKRQWVHVFNSCWERFHDDGRCIAMANGVLSRRVGADDAIVEALSPDAITDGVLDGEPVWLVPTIFTREGVQNRGFKSWEELEKSEWSLVDLPVSFGHPPGDDTIYQHPELIIGRVLEHEADEKGRALHGISAIFKHDWRSRWVIKALSAGIGRHGSVGFAHTIDERPGSFDGTSFLYSEQDIFYDHFAVGLEYFGKRGACPPPACGLLFNTGCEHMTDSEKSKLEQARDIITSMNIFDSAHVEAAIGLFADDVVCESCDTANEKLGDAILVAGDQRYSFSPPWSQVDKSALPRTAFMVVGDPELKTTWKLPYKNPDGTINCNAIRAIVQVLGGARGGVDLTAEQRASARRQSAGHWRRCLALRERQGDAEHPSCPDGEVWDIEQGKCVEMDTKTPESHSSATAVQEILYSGRDINGIEDFTMSDEPAKPDATAAKAEIEGLQKQLADTLSALESAKKEIVDRNEAELASLRESMKADVGDSGLYTPEEIGAMSKDAITVSLKAVKAFRDARPKTDHGLKGVNSSGNAQDMDVLSTEFIRGNEYYKLSVGDLYEKPVLNPRADSKGGE